MGSGEEEDDGGLTPTEDEDDVQRPSGPPESVSALVNRGYRCACSLCGGANSVRPADNERMNPLCCLRLVLYNKYLVSR